MSKNKKTRGRRLLSVACTAKKLKLFKEEIVALSSAYRNDHENLEALRSRYKARAKIRDHGRACEDLHVLIKRYPDSVQISIDYSLQCFWMGKKKKGYKHLHGLMKSFESKPSSVHRNISLCAIVWSLCKMLQVDKVFQRIFEMINRLKILVPKFRDLIPSMIILEVIVETRLKGVLSQKNEKILNDFVKSKENSVLKVRDRRYFLMEHIADLFIHLKKYDRGIKLCEYLRRDVLIPEDHAARLMRVAILESSTHEKLKRKEKAVATVMETLLMLETVEEREMESLVEEVEGGGVDDDDDDDDDDDGDDGDDDDDDDDELEEEDLESDELEKEEAKDNKNNNNNNKNQGTKKSEKTKYVNRNYRKPIMGLSEIPNHTVVMADVLCRLYARYNEKKKLDELLKRYNTLNMTNPPLCGALYGKMQKVGKRKRVGKALVNRKTKIRKKNRRLVVNEKDIDRKRDVMGIAKRARTVLEQVVIEKQKKITIP